MSKTVSSKQVTVVFLAVLVVILAGMLVWLLLDRQQQHQSAVGNAVNADEMAAQRLSTEMKDLLASDSYFFSGQFAKALQSYEILSESAEQLGDSIFKKRISFTEKMLSNLSSNIVRNADEAVSAPIQDDVVIALRQDSTQKVVEKISDSMNMKIVELNRQIRDRNRELEQKENLQNIILKGAGGASIHYLGETKNGMANGVGTGVWDKSGGVYKGEWKNNQRHGNGRYTWKDGEKYDGSFVDDRREGKGTYTWLSGERYEGIWKNNKREGQGTMFDKDGNINYKGLWENDKPKSR